MLARDKSALNRALRRNSGLKGYRPKQAHERAMRRRIEKATPYIDRQIWQQIETLIGQEWRS